MINLPECTRRYQDMGIGFLIGYPKVQLVVNSVQIVVTCTTTLTENKTRHDIKQKENFLHQK